MPSIGTLTPAKKRSVAVMLADELAVRAPISEKTDAPL